MTKFQQIIQGKVVSLSNGHMPQFLFGTDAQKPVTPGAGDTYYATDSLKTYICYVNGIWSVANRFPKKLEEEVSNHDGTTSNILETATTGTGSAATQAATHLMRLTCPASSSARYDYLPSYAVTARDLAFTSILATITVGSGGTARNIHVGFMDSFPAAGAIPTNCIEFFYDASVPTWYAVTSNAGTVTQTALTGVFAPGNGKRLQILSKIDYVQFFANGNEKDILTNIPTAAMQPAIYIVADGALASNIVIDVDYIGYIASELAE